MFSFSVYLEKKCLQFVYATPLVKETVSSLFLLDFSPLIYQTFAFFTLIVIYSSLLF